MSRAGMAAPVAWMLEAAIGTLTVGKFGGNNRPANR
jgi:hypothetical protein